MVVEGTISLGLLHWVALRVGLDLEKLIDFPLVNLTTTDLFEKIS